MNRIDQKFIELREKKQKALIAFVTAGDPSLEATGELVVEMEKAGADIIELGVPFSDPMADGATIQAASFRSLERGTTLKKILELVRSVRRVSQVPIALMTYYNPVLYFGDEKFVSEAKAAGVDGLIIPDLPLEESGDLLKAARKSDLSLVFFLAATTTKERMARICESASGFVYFVAVAGVTGARVSLPTDIARHVKMARSITKVPVCVGFGISTPDQVREVASFADGVIVGSAIIKEIEKRAQEKDMPVAVGRFVKRLASAL